MHTSFQQPEEEELDWGGADQTDHFSAYVL